MAYDRSLLSSIYDILVRCCGASEMESDRDAFVNLAETYAENGHPLEYRFVGSLGFGGKVWIKSGNVPYVSCYQEDETPARRKAIDQANLELAWLIKNVA